MPYWAWAVFIAALFTWLNILGIRTSAHINAGLAAGMGVVIAIFFVCAARFIFGQSHGAGFFTQLFFDPATVHTRAVLGATSIAVLTYIGFDGISTLTEEAENPRRNILGATVFTCLVIGVLSMLQVYAAQLAWPASSPFPDETPAFVYVAEKTWAPLFVIVGLTLVVANLGSGMGAPLRAARLSTEWDAAMHCRSRFRRHRGDPRHSPQQRVLRRSGQPDGRFPARPRSRR